MSGDARAPACHDALVHNVFGQRDAMACLLRRVLPRDLLPYVDFCSLRAAPTKHTDDVLRRRRSDLHYIVDVVDGDMRVSIHILVEHQSTPAPRMPKRAFGYLDDVWDEYIHDHPEDEGTLPFAVLILLTQHPARNSARHPRAGSLGSPPCCSCWPPLVRVRTMAPRPMARDRAPASTAIHSHPQVMSPPWTPQGIAVVRDGGGWW